MINVPRLVTATALTHLFGCNESRLSRFIGNDAGETDKLEPMNGGSTDRKNMASYKRPNAGQKITSANLQASRGMSEKSQSSEEGSTSVDQERSTAR